MNIRPVKGTRDFFPEDMRLRNWLFGHFREVARLFNFEEYDTPVLESEELYIRKAGEEITDQLYNFEDKGGRRVALRPEMTPSLARLILQKGGALSLPVRWFSIPQCWRYERMSKGRKREHYQWNMDFFGVPEITAEAELLAALTTFFKRVGLTAGDIVIKVSSRKVIQSILDELKVPEESFAAVCILIDKLEKVPVSAIENDLQALDLDPQKIEKIVTIRDINTIDDLAERLGDQHEVVNELRTLFDLAEAYQYREWLTFDASIVRGLAYYTGTVFEAFYKGTSLRAVLGGGRYDRLLSTFGGKDLPACGFGFGDVVIMEVLKEKGLIPALDPRVDDVIFAFDDTLRKPAVEIANLLREKGRSVELVLEDKKMKALFKQADRLGAERVLLLAPEEWQRREVRVKMMQSGKEANVSLDSL